MYPRVVETAGFDPNEMDFYIQMAEDEINGTLAKFYSIPFSSNMHPIRTITELLAAHAMLRTLITQEDPSRSDWVQQLRERGEALLTAIADGKMDIVAATSGGGAATLLSRVSGVGDQVWSDTSGYKPTMDLRDPIEQRVSPTRLEDMDAADTADSV